MASDSQPARVAPRNRVIGDRIVERPRSVTAAPVTILAFPMGRRREVLVRVTAAAMMRTRSPDGADRCVGKALREYTTILRQEGVPAAVLRREVHILEAQIRAAVWWLMFPWASEEAEVVQGGRRPRKPRRAPTQTAQMELALPPVGGGQWLAR